jgi:hypothetical protein
MQSLQARLGVSLAISLVALSILEWFVVSPAIRKLTDDYVTSRLRLDAASLLALVTIRMANLKSTLRAWSRYISAP